MSNGRNKEVTSSSVASKAAKILQSNNSSPEAKKVAASALTQHPNKGTGKNAENTSKKIASLAGGILSDPKSRQMDKSVAASVLTQTKKP
jgi:hypothetical protein